MRNFKYEPLNGQRKRFNFKHLLLAIVGISILALSVSAVLRRQNHLDEPFGHCEGISIFDRKLMKKVEPSDLVWNINDRGSSSTFYVVSDDGRVLEMDIHGSIIQTWALGEDIDLEAVALVPGE